MNCPGHCFLYAGDVRSYRDLPIKIAEYGPLARYEPSGTLHGALRVRGLSPRRRPHFRAGRPD